MIKFWPGSNFAGSIRETDAERRMRHAQEERNKEEDDTMSLEEKEAREDKAFGEWLERQKEQQK